MVLNKKGLFKLIDKEGVCDGGLCTECLIGKSIIKEKGILECNPDISIKVAEYLIKENKITLEDLKMNYNSLLFLNLY